VAEDNNSVQRPVHPDFGRVIVDGRGLRMSAKSNSTSFYLDGKTWGNKKEDFAMSKCKLYLRRFRSPNGFGLTLFRPDRLNPYFVLFLRPRQRRFLLRLPRHLVGISWWPPRVLDAAVLRAER
jgi:hypothetical protein